MDRRYRKMEEKTADRGDLKKSLLQKLFHDLDIADLMPNRDRGDSKTNTVRQTRILINNHDKPGNYIHTQRQKMDRKRNIEITVSEVTPKKVEEIIIRDDLETEQQNKDDQKKIEESKAKNLTKTSSNKLKTVNKLPVLQERPMRFRPELHKVEDRTREIDKMRSIDEKGPRTDQRFRKTDENSKTIGSKINKISERHEPFKRMEITPRIDLLTRDENCGTEEVPEKQKFNENTKADERATDRVKNRFLPKESKINDRNINLKGPIQSYEARKLLRQKYTVKLRNANRNVESKDDNLSKGNERYATGEGNIQTQDEPKERDHVKEPDIPHPQNRIKKTKDVNVQRKPIIKTIRLSHDNRVYKAVTFVEDREPVPPLQIKMPNQKKSVETNTVKNKIVKVTLSKVSMNEKRNKKVYREKKPRREKVRNRPLSPVFPIAQGCSQTEVAKWAPSSINQLTKPYYEAWVDTTLTAITKCSEEEKDMLNQQNIIRTFKRAIDLQRPNSPDLVYEKMHDEKFIGRITVKQKR